MTRLLTAVLALLTIGSTGDFASAQSIPHIAEADFQRLHALIKPRPDESPWRDIAWLTNVTEARRRAVAEDKPLVFFTAADGSPLGRT